MPSPITDTNPRAFALRLIAGVLAGHKMLSTLTAEPWATAAPGPVQAAGQRLALSVLRHLSRADACLKPHLGKPIQPQVRDLLRLGVTELWAEGEAPHGVVDSAVALAKTTPRLARARGLVNAVLRRVAETGREPWDSAPDPRLPNWLRGRLSSAHGNHVATQIESAHARGAALDLTPRADAEGWAERLGATLLPTRSLRISGQAQVSALPGYGEGAWWVQDAAAALPARVLNANPEERVLDLCAAPGGKTLQLAATGADVTALDISETRLARVQENLDRTRLAATLVAADALTYQAEPFDAVLLDAPCSATGTIRRHPDLPHVRDVSSLKELKTLQKELLTKAVSLTKRGGRLVYSTCSLLSDEGEAILDVAKSLGLSPDREATARLTGADPAWNTGPGVLRTRPDQWADHGGSDGFFIAAFRA